MVTLRMLKKPASRKKMLIEAIPLAFQRWTTLLYNDFGQFLNSRYEFVLSNFTVTETPAYRGCSIVSELQLMVSFRPCAPVVKSKNNVLRSFHQVFSILSCIAAFSADFTMGIGDREARSNLSLSQLEMGHSPHASDIVLPQHSLSYTHVEPDVKNHTRSMASFPKSDNSSCARRAPDAKDTATYERNGDVAIDGRKMLHWENSFDKPVYTRKKKPSSASRCPNRKPSLPNPKQFVSFSEKLGSPQQQHRSAPHTAGLGGNVVAGDGYVKSHSSEAHNCIRLEGHQDANKEDKSTHFFHAIILPHVMGVGAPAQSTLILPEIIELSMPPLDHTNSVAFLHSLWGDVPLTPPLTENIKEELDTRLSRAEGRPPEEPLNEEERGKSGTQNEKAALPQAYKQPEFFLPLEKTAPFYAATGAAAKTQKNNSSNTLFSDNERAAATINCSEREYKLKKNSREPLVEETYKEGPGTASSPPVEPEPDKEAVESESESVAAETAVAGEEKPISETEEGRKGPAQPATTPTIGVLKPLEEKALEEELEREVASESATPTERSTQAADDSTGASPAAAVGAVNQTKTSSEEALSATSAKEHALENPTRTEKWGTTLPASEHLATKNEINTTAPASTTAEKTADEVEEQPRGAEDVADKEEDDGKRAMQNSQGGKRIEENELQHQQSQSTQITNRDNAWAIVSHSSKQPENESNMFPTEPSTEQPFITSTAKAKKEAAPVHGERPPRPKSSDLLLKDSETANEEQPTQKKYIPSTPDIQQLPKGSELKSAATEAATTHASAKPESLAKASIAQTTVREGSTPHVNAAAAVTNSRSVREEIEGSSARAERSPEVVLKFCKSQQLHCSESDESTLASIRIFIDTSIHVDLSRRRDWLHVGEAINYWLREHYFNNRVYRPMYAWKQALQKCVTDWGRKMHRFEPRWIIKRVSGRMPTSRKREMFIDFYTQHSPTDPPKLSSVTCFRFLTLIPYFFITRRENDENEKHSLLLLCSADSEFMPFLRSHPELAKHLIPPPPPADIQSTRLFVDPTISHSDKSELGKIYSLIQQQRHQRQRESQILREILHMQETQQAAIRQEKQALEEKLHLQMSF